MKTYKNIDIKYYDNDGNIHVRCSVPVTQDALVHYELMQSHYCKLSFKLYKPTYFLLGDFIDTPYGRFELIDLLRPKIMILLDIPMKSNLMHIIVSSRTKY